MIKITSGDTALLRMLAKDGDGGVFDITGAVFTTYIKKSDGTNLSIANAAHAVVSAAAGTFTITLTATDTGALTPGIRKDIVTKIVQNTSTIYFHGKGILEVLSPDPEN